MIARFFRRHRKLLALLAFGAPVLALFVFVVFRAGPLAPVRVTLATVETRAVRPALFGVGLVEARYAHRIGPTTAGRLSRVDAQPGDRVAAGQTLAEIDPLDLDDRIGAQDAALRRTQASLLASEAQIQEVGARKLYAQSQSERYEQLYAARTVSEATIEAKRQDLQVAQASLRAAQANREAALKDLERLRAERDGLVRQRENLRLVSPVAGIVTQRDADPGTTVVAGQTVVEVVAPENIWVNARFDQQRSHGLKAGLSARLRLRSHGAGELAGRVARVEPRADAVTEETLAKIEFAPPADPPPPIGELVEATVELDAQPPRPTILNASLQRVDGRLGVWRVDGKTLRFAPVKIGPSDLDGRVQIVEGLRDGDTIVVHSEKPLKAQSRIAPVERLAGDER